MTKILTELCVLLSITHWYWCNVVRCLRGCLRRWMSWMKQSTHCRLALTVWRLSTIPWVRHTFIASCWHLYALLLLVCQEGYLVCIKHMVAIAT